MTESASVPENERERLAALRSYRILDTGPEERFDRLTRLAARLFGKEIALVSLVDEARQWFKSRHGIDTAEMPREIAFCAHAILTDGVMVVEDASADPRFADNPLVRSSPNIRFYAGAPLIDRDGFGLGTLCVLDRRPVAHFSDGDRAQLADLAALVVDELELRRSLADLSAAHASLRLAKDEAEAANAAKSEFLAVMSHEMRTPLNGVMGSLGVLLDSALTQEQARFAEGALRSARMLFTLISDLLDLSKIEAGDVGIEMTDFDARELVGQAIELLRPAARDKDIGLTLKVDPELPSMVRSDPARTHQILINLMSNAVKFTPRGAVEVGLGFAPGPAPGEPAHLLIDVVDTGVGIPPERRSRLFQTFEKGDSSIRRRFGGTGLGLSICQRLTWLLGGTIGVDSDGESGSRFWVRLPVEPALGVAADGATAAAAEPAAFKGRILLAEDSQTNAVVATALLERRGARVDLVGNGREALDAVRQRPYDLIIMDIAMPEMDGLTATRQIRAQGGVLARLPILGITAHAMPGDEKACRDAGMDHYLTKPIDRAAFLKAVGDLLARAPAAPAAAPAGAPAAVPMIDRDQVAEIWGELDQGSYREVVGVFLDELEQRLADLREAAAEDDRRAIGRHAHALKGAAANVGGRPLSAAAAALEAAAGTAAPGELLRLVRNLQETGAATSRALAASDDPSR
jgi:signal transduction histidine kinase/DNA-binding response OmpR family regulator